MNAIQHQIKRYIQGNLSDEEIDHLHKHVLVNRVWYDYYITELTASHVKKSGDVSNLSFERFPDSLPIRTKPTPVHF